MSTPAGTSRADHTAVGRLSFAAHPAGFRFQELHLPRGREAGLLEADEAQVKQNDARNTARSASSSRCDLLSGACAVLRDLRENLDQFPNASFRPLSAGAVDGLSQLNGEFVVGLIKLSRMVPSLRRSVTGIVYRSPTKAFSLGDRIHDSASHAILDVAKRVKESIPFRASVLQKLRDRACGKNMPTTLGSDASRWQDLRTAIDPEVPSNDEIKMAQALVLQELNSHGQERSISKERQQLDSTIWTKAGSLRQSAKTVLEAYDEKNFRSQEEIADLLHRARDYVAKVTPALVEARFLEALHGGGMRRTEAGSKALST